MRRHGLPGMPSSALDRGTHIPPEIPLYPEAPYFRASACRCCGCGQRQATVGFEQTAPQPIVAPLMQQDLADMPGREMLMLSVEYPPGTVEHIHRHDAYAFVYVLEGTIVEGVKGGKEVILTPGQTFYEGPNDVHTIGRNASTTRPAKFVVVLVKKKGVDAVLPAE